MKYLARIKILSAMVLLLALQGCISTIVGTVVDTAIEVVKVPFKVGGAIIDAASSKEEDKKTKPEKE
ncbi:MAG: hypothetical protein RL020_1208 [Pseudomonadota bacterium]|jgi:hypothetical protein